MQNILIVVNTFIFKHGRVAVLKRVKQKAWSIPGGHLEFGEMIKDCAKREALEETGLEIENIEILGYTEHIHDDMHYLMFWARADYKAGVLRNPEPERCMEVRWTEIGRFPEPVFRPVRTFLDSGSGRKLLASSEK